MKILFWVEIQLLASLSTLVTKLKNYYKPEQARRREQCW